MGFGSRCCRCGQYVHWQWAILGLGSGTRIQIYGDWLNDRLLGPFHYYPQSTMGRLLPSSPIGRQQHQCRRIQNFLPSLLVATVDTTPPPWCHFGTLPLDSLPLDDQATGQALKLNTVSCQFSYPFQLGIEFWSWEFSTVWIF